MGEHTKAYVEELQKQWREKNDEVNEASDDVEIAKNREAVLWAELEAIENKLSPFAKIIESSDQYG